jgi:two-component system, chemotaxis family, protein-glutamate methylesterase/glutaminase
MRAPRAHAALTAPTTPQLVIAIAASTGGPAALSQLVPALPAWPDVAVVIVQHMPVGFTGAFARRLNGRAALQVCEAEQGMPLHGGTVYVAPAGVHCLVDGDPRALRVALEASAPLWGVRPAADRLFQSVAQRLGADVVGVVLTGMGQDGAEGLCAIRAAGGLAIIQDAASCVVNGMPEAARRRAGADAVVPLGGMAAALEAAVHCRRRAAVAA